MAEQTQQDERDLTSDGIALAELADGAIVGGMAGDQKVVVVLKDGNPLAIGGECTHYGGPLAEGVFDGTLIRCPWHHACFNAMTGEATWAPALNDVPAFQTEERDGRIYVSGTPVAAEPRQATGAGPASVVIVGGGAAGNAAAEMLRREGYKGTVTMVSAEEELPYDRPNLSKSYLSGEAPPDWIPLRDEEFYGAKGIDLVRGRRVSSIDVAGKALQFEDGGSLAFDALILATGASPNGLPVPGSDSKHVHLLRSFADSEGIAKAAESATGVAVIGASFIGMEVAAALRKRGLDVHVVAPEKIPMETVLGPELGSFLQGVHEDEGVQFHLERTAKEIRADSVVLDDGTEVKADLVVIGIGVKPNVELAEGAGIDVDDGVPVDEFFRTSQPGIWAVGDIASWPDRRSGERIRVEHWVVAERQGQAAARNIMGGNEPFHEAPFFWTEQYDTVVTYVGHATKWDRIEVIGSVEDRDALVAFHQGGKVMAMAAIFRDRESLLAEVAMSRDDEQSLKKLLR